MNHRRVSRPFAVVLALLGVILGACGSGGGLPLADAPFRSEAGGFSMRYPEGWEYLDEYGQVVIAPSQEIMEEFNYGVPSEPAVLIMAGTLESLVWDTEVQLQDSQDLLDYFTADVPRSIEISKARNASVGGEDGLFVDLSGEWEASELSGRIVVVHLGQRGAIIMVLCEPEDWKPFIPTFQSMLSSATFFEP
jgi:hypothetical protein